VLALALVLAWSAARVHFVNGGNWTALFCSGAGVPLPPELDAGTYRVPVVGYDGQFYRLLAHDPFLRKGYARYADAPRFRFRRSLIPWLAWLLALGSDRWIDGAYIAVEMLFVALGTYWCARLLARRGRSPWWGLLFLAAPATIASVDRMVLDGPLTAWFAGFLLYCEEERWRRVWVLAALAGLTRETGLLMAAALVADRLLRRDWRGAARFAACAVPSLAWYAYLAAHVPASHSLPEIGIPVWSLFARLLVFRTYFSAIGQVVLRVTDLLAVAGLIASVIVAAVWLRKAKIGPASLCVALYACLALMLGVPVMFDPFAFGRVISPLLLWVLMEAVSRKNWAALAPPLAISLNVSLVFARPVITIAQALFRR
jgi:hypothetical protein